MADEDTPQATISQDEALVEEAQAASEPAAEADKKTKTTKAKKAPKKRSAEIYNLLVKKSIRTF